MEYVKTIENLFLKTSELFEKKGLRKRKIDTLQEALVLVGGENEGIAAAIATLEAECGGDNTLFASLQSDMKKEIERAFPAFFATIDSKFSFEKFSIEENQLYDSRMRRVNFSEGKTGDPVYKTVGIPLKELEDHRKDESPCVLYLLKITTRDDGRSGDKRALRCNVLQNGTIEYASGHYRSGDSPPFQAGYVYDPISREEFWEEF